MRDRGTKKNKYKFGSGDQSTVERRRSTLRTRDTNLHKRWGSDEDLVRDLGLSVSRGMWEEDLNEEGEQPDLDLPQHPPAVAKFGDKNGLGPYSNHGFGGSSRSLGSKHGKGPGVNKHWRFPARQPGTRSHGDNISEETESIIASASQTGLSSKPQSPEPHDIDSPATLASARSGGKGASSKMTFFDVGNLLHADDARERQRQDSHPGNAITVSQQLQSHHHRRKSSLLAAGFGTTTVISAMDRGRATQAIHSPTPAPTPASSPHPPTKTAEPKARVVIPRTLVSPAHLLCLSPPPQRTNQVIFRHLERGALCFYRM